MRLPCGVVSERRSKAHQLAAPADVCPTGDKYDGTHNAECVSTAAAGTAGMQHCLTLLCTRRSAGDSTAGSLPADVSVHKGMCRYCAFADTMSDRKHCVVARTSGPARASRRPAAPRRRRPATCCARGTAAAGSAPGAWCPTRRLRVQGPQNPTLGALAALGPGGRTPHTPNDSRLGRVLCHGTFSWARSAGQPMPPRQLLLGCAPGGDPRTPSGGAPRQRVPSPSLQTPSDKGPNRQGSEPARVRNPYTEALPRNLTLNPNQHHAPGNHRCTISLYASQSAGSGPTKAARQNVRSSDMWWPTAGRPQPRMASNTAVAPAARWMAATRSCARARRAPSREA